MVETPDIVLWSPWSPMIANDRRVTAFVLSMLKTNAKVRRSNLERGENAVGSRRSWAKRRNISIDVVHAQYTRGKDAAKMVTFAKAISWVLNTTPIPWRPHHDHIVFITVFRFHHHIRRYPQLANTTPNVYCWVWLHNDRLEISEKFDPLNI